MVKKEEALLSYLQKNSFDKTEMYKMLHNVHIDDQICTTIDASY